MAAEREDRFVHRIEAFSDIVIGFSLAQLGATLVMPAHAQALIDNPGWLFGFLWTFALVCLMWWNHNRIFRAGFRATPASLLLNFILLATIVLIVYFAQVFARVSSLHDGLVAARLYFAALGLSAIVTAFLYYVNLGVTRGAIVNAVSGLVQCAGVLASLLAGDRIFELTMMGVLVPLAWTFAALIARRVPQAVVVR